jgi:hypothetical protein
MQHLQCLPMRQRRERKENHRRKKPEEFHLVVRANLSVSPVFASFFHSPRITRICTNKELAKIRVIRVIRG